MSPADDSRRLGNLEQGMARLEQRVDDLATDVRVMAPLIVQMAEQKIQMGHVSNAVDECSARVVALRRDLELTEKAREAERVAERKESRRTRLTLLSGVLFVVLSTVGGLIVQLSIAGHTP